MMLMMNPACVLYASTQCILYIHESTNQNHHRNEQNVDVLYGIRSTYTHIPALVQCNRSKSCTHTHNPSMFLFCLINLLCIYRFPFFLVIFANAVVVAAFCLHERRFFFPLRHFWCKWFVFDFLSPIYFLMV